MITTFIALLVIILLKNKIFRIGKTLLLFDTIGLGLFTVVGISKSVEMGLPIWTSIIMGTITGCVGGVIRDIIINDVPLLFRRDIYAIPCIIGGIMYFLFIQLQIIGPLPELLAVLTVIFIRIIAVKFHLHLPKLNTLYPEIKGK